jgi:hypothetical protein
MIWDLPDLHASRYWATRIERAAVLPERVYQAR